VSGCHRGPSRLRPSRQRLPLSVDPAARLERQRHPQHRGQNLVVTTADRLTAWLVRHRANPLRLPEAPDPRPGSAHERLATAALTGDVLFHGSNAREIPTFEPRDQLTARDRPVRAVFATPDPLWAMFFAVTDTRRSIGRWNACLRPEETGLARSRYFFAVRGRPRSVWADGAVYVLPSASFQPSDIPAEWISFEPVEPLEVVPVTRADFPFAQRVFQFTHPESDWIRLLRLVRNGLFGFVHPQRACRRRGT
jgi:hypothetical protein